MTALLAMVRANFTMSLRNRAALFWNLAFPALFIVIFGVVFGRGESVHFEVGITGAESAYRDRVVQAMSDSPTFTVSQGSQEEELRELARGSRGVVAVFADSGSADQLPAVTIYYNATQGRWYAGSGAFFDMNANDRRPDTWTSADAAGLAMFPGLVRYDEAWDPAVTNIGHAFRVTVRATRLPNGLWSSGRLLPLPKFSERSPMVRLESGAVEIVDPSRTPHRLRRVVVGHRVDAPLVDAVVHEADQVGPQRVEGVARQITGRQPRVEPVPVEHLGAEDVAGALPGFRARREWDAPGCQGLVYCLIDCIAHGFSSSPVKIVIRRRAPQVLAPRYPRQATGSACTARRLQRRTCRRRRPA